MDAATDQFSAVWNSNLFGVTVGQLAVAAIVLLAFVLLRRLFARVIVVSIKKLTARTETTVDDQILEALRQPLMFVFVIAGIYFVIEWVPFGPDIEKALEHILRSLIAFTIFWTAYRLVDPISFVFDKLLSRFAAPVANEAKDYLLKFLKVFLVGSGVVAVLAQWGIDPWPYFAGIGVLSLPFAFAAKDSVANVFGGIKLILIDQVFKVGDWIETPSVGHGTVEEVTLSMIRIRKFTKAIQTVPNGLIVNEPITNWSRMSHRRIEMDIGLTYDTSTAQFTRILERIRGFIAGDERIDHDTTEMIHMVRFNASSIDINLYYFTKTTSWADWRQIIEEHLLAFMKIVEEEGSSFAFPTRSIHVEGVPEGLVLAPAGAREA
jgi:MscS family membrane protein